MTRVPFHGVFLVVAGAWLATLGACGRTLPGLEPGDWAAGGDEATGAGGSNGARGGASAQGGTSGTSTGGSNRGGTSNGGSNRGGTSNGGSNRGGTSNGGTSTDVGGALNVGGTGEGGSNRGGTSGTSAGGSGAVGGSAGDVGDGGSVSVGGAVGNGGTVGLGGSTAVGGAGGSVSGAGGTSSMGGTGGTSTPPPGGIVCGEELCDPDQQVCCARRGNPSYCMAPGEDCPGSTLGCSGPTTCAAGEVCCWHSRSSSCAATCDVSVGSPGNPPTIILCDRTEDCAADQICVVAPRGLAYCADAL